MMTAEKTTPTVEQFKKALLALRPINAGHMTMLKAHFRSPDHSLTATQLAEAAGYASYSGANMQYGLLGKAIGEHLMMHAPMRAEDGTPVWTSILASGAEGSIGAPHYVWRMRPELVVALTELPWGFNR